MQRSVAAVALILLTVCIWSLTHRYRDLVGDAELYALQALSKLHPALATDLFLQNDSQDRYTVFSRAYAWLIGWAGLHEAARDLFLVCSAWFLVAAWLLVRRLSGAATAWLSVLLLMMTTGQYGSYGVFGFFEEFLTARSVAEALIVTALACFYFGQRLCGLGIAVAALVIHPLMAFPGVLLIACLWAGLRTSIAAALAGIGAAALIAKGAQLTHQPDGYLALIDGEWLTVVRERSQFLFLQLWRFTDWKNNALPFANLGLTLLVVRDPRIRQLAFAGMVVGATGLAVAWIASTIGPIALLLQGQAWRWVWIPSFLSILLVAPTLAAMRADSHCGALTIVTLLGAWTCAAVDTWLGIGLAAILWLSRPWLTDRIGYLFRWAALALAVVLAAWTIGTALTTLGAPSPESGREAPVLALARNVLGLHTTTLVLAGIIYWLLTRTRSVWVPALVCVPLASVAVATMPGAMLQVVTAGTPSEIAAYANWRAAIPTGANVAVSGVPNATGFVWFTLDRPSYLSVDQSSGVVFSRATALEVKRRSDVLAPLLYPSWKLMTRLTLAASHTPMPEVDAKPLTAAGLASVCRDDTLVAVIAHEFIGFGALRHDGNGSFKGWYLYDCRTVRAASVPA